MSKNEKFVLHGAAHLAAQAVASEITKNHNPAGKKRGAAIAVAVGLFLNFLIEKL